MKDCNDKVFVDDNGNETKKPCGCKGLKYDSKDLLLYLGGVSICFIMIIFLLIIQIVKNDTTPEIKPENNYSKPIFNIINKNNCEGISGLDIMKNNEQNITVPVYIEDRQVNTTVKERLRVVENNNTKISSVVTEQHTKPYRVATYFLNVRDTKSKQTSENIIEVLKKDTLVHVTNIDNGWASIGINKWVRISTLYPVK